MPEPTTIPSTLVVASKKRAPGPHSLSPFGAAAAMARDTKSFALDMWHRYGDVVRFRFLLWRAYVLYHPDAVKHVFQDNHLNYNKDFFNMDAAKPLFGNGLFTNDGESWLQQRRLMQPAFHRKRIAAFGTLMSEATLAMLERWQGYSEQETVEVSEEMMRVTLRIAGLALFNLDLSNEVDIVGRTFTEIRPLLTKYTNVPFPPLWVPTPSNRRLQAGLDTLNTVVYGIINEQRKRAADAETNTGDLLSMLLAARDEETGEGMSDKQVRDEVMTLLLAGHETTATALTWVWYVLSQYPEVFDPERFIPERSAGRPRFAYFPFGGGPRQCIGNTFALMEAQMVLATVAQRYRLRLVLGHPVEPQVSITMRPRYGLPMTLQAL